MSQDPKAKSPQFLYLDGEKRGGPISGQQLKELAVSGGLSPTAMIWQDGIEAGVLASKVKGLFDRPPSGAKPDSAARDVFISYSSRDKTIADAICAKLEEDKIRCWIAPRDLLPGMHYPEALIDGINVSRTMVVVLSLASNRSPHVLREVERAVSKGIPIIPFRIEDVVPSKSMEFFLSTPHWLDALTKPVEAHIQRLTSVVRAVLKPGSSQQSARSDREANHDASLQRSLKSYVVEWQLIATQHVSVIRQKLASIPERTLKLYLERFAVWSLHILPVWSTLRFWIIFAQGGCDGEALFKGFTGAGIGGG